MLSLLPPSALILAAGAGAALLIFAVIVRDRRSRLLHLAAKLPGPPTVPLLGNALTFAVDQEHLMSTLGDLIRKYGDVMRMWMGPDLNVVVADPDDLKTLLSSPKLSEKGPTYKYMAEYLGGGILSGSGHSWRRHRKIVSPNYGKRAIESYSTVFDRETAELLQRLRAALPSHAQLDVYREVARATTYSVCQTLMALNKEEATSLPYLHDIIDMTGAFYTSAFNRMTKWYHQFYLFHRFTSSYKTTQLYFKMTKEFGKAIIECRKKSLKQIIVKDISLDPEDDSLKNTELGVIDRLILSKELDDKELIDETFTIFTSSQEASAKITSFMLLMMAYHTEYQERLYSEISSVLGDRGSDEALTESDIKKMTYLDWVYKECLRLFPIGAVIQRTVSEEIRISSCTLPAGCSLLAPIYQMSRDPRYWERPEHFYPNHFAPENVAKRPANCYLPFSVGPMDCLGRYFGSKLIKTICVGVIRQFKLSSDQTYEDLRIKVAISIASIDGFKMHLTHRK